MIYVYWYLGIGAITLVSMLVSHNLSKEPESKELKDLLEAINPERKKLSYRVFENYVVPTIASALMLVVWPVALYMKVKDMRDRGPGGSLEKKEFKVAKHDLLDSHTIEQVESTELVFDPLGAVPNLPFGHLNKCWLDFLNQMLVGDELWSFKTTWEHSWGLKEIRYGYVLVRDGSPDAYMLTEIIRLEN